MAQRCRPPRLRLQAKASPFGRARPRTAQPGQTARPGAQWRRRSPRRNREDRPISPDRWSPAAFWRPGWRRRTGQPIARQKRWHVGSCVEARLQTWSTATIRATPCSVLDWLMGYLASLQEGILRNLAAELRAGGLGTAVLAFL